MKVNLDDVKRILNFFFIVFLCCHSAEAQKAVTFKTGTFSLDHVNAIERSDDHSIYLFYSTDHILSTLERKSLDENGIEILYTLHDNIYWVRIKGEVNKTYLKYLFQIDPSYKIGQQAFDRDTVRSQRHGNIEKMKSKPDVRVSPDVRESPTVNMPEWRISIAPGLSLTEITKWAETNRITILDSRALQFGFIDVSVAANSFDDLINTQWISFIDNIPHDEPVNYRMINAERGWGLKSPLTRNLDGSGMTVGIGDEGRIGTHQDLSNSLLDLTSFSISSHSTEVAGIITGAGLVNPAFGSGYAPNAFVLTRNFSDILWASPQYISDFNLSLTNNSYGANLTDCTSIGDYDGTSAGLDQMMRDYPSLLHVFAAANSGGITCSPYPAGYATVAGGYQPSKNVLTVGAISITDTNASFSSRGPVDDGRLKPEVVA
ncbi:MAG: S8 family serine peptidase, partial [Saprospiraceae bacterium]